MEFGGSYIHLHIFSCALLGGGAQIDVVFEAESGYTIRMNSSMKKRDKTVKQAIANEKLEGLKVSPASRKIADGYVTGKISAKSVAAKIRARYGTL